jgi:hypothetical protein
MSEREQLQQLNEGLRAVQGTIERIEITLVGDEFNKNGLINRLESIEKKQRKFDSILYTILGVVTFGSYPLLKELISEYFKVK